MATATARLLEEIVSVGTRLASRFEDARRELEAEQRQRRDFTESPMLTDRFESLEALLREMREENKRRISELQSQLAGETAAREEKEKEVSALAARLSQAEELLAYQKEEICKIREANSPAQSGTNTVGQDEGRVSSKEMKSLVSALVAQSAEAVKTLEQQKEETKKVWEAIFVTSKRGPTSADLKIIHSPANTTVMDLTGGTISDFGILHLPYLTSLKSLNISSASEVAALTKIFTMTWLEELKFQSACFFSDSDFMGISNLTALRRLELRDPKVSKYGLAHLTCLGSLKVLHLSRCVNVPSAGMVHVGKLIWLEELKLESHSFDDSVVREISNLTDLRRLELIAPQVSDEGLAHLTCLGSLKVLILSGGMNISSAGLVHVGKMTSLEALDIGSLRVMDDGTHLAPLSKLTWLALPEQVTVQGMKNLTCLNSLSTIWLRSSYDYSHSVVGGLKTLPCLETLGVRDGRTAEVLMEHLPTVHVTVTSNQSEFYPAGGC